MLSFDITDRNIRIVKGTESGGKIRVMAAMEVELDEAIIHNGHVQDINRLVAFITRTLGSVGDKEAMISIASNQTVFKELSVPTNPKESEFLKNIQLELKNQIGVDESFLIGYVKVGEPVKEDGDPEPMQRVLATACPRDVIDAYKRVFMMLNIRLVSVMISCNAITKILLADAKNQAKMPLLAVQLGKDAVSLNLYEDNALSFSRFASIDPEDYDDPDDYIFEAACQNIQRMNQFVGIRGSEDIKNIIFYGDLEASTNLYQRLCDHVEKEYEIPTAKLTAPPQIQGGQKLNFSVYANAIGAMFKRGTDERVNLLETDTSSPLGKVQDESTFMPMAIGGIVLSVLVIGVAFGVIAGIDNNYKKQTADYRATIDSPETAAKLAQYDDLQIKKDAVQVYADNINHASNAYKTRPVVNETLYTAIDESVEAVMNETEHVQKVEYSVSYEDGVFVVPITADISSDDPVQKYPSNLIQYLYDHYGDASEVPDENKLFSSVTYSGYSMNVPSAGDLSQPEQQLSPTIEFELRLEMLPGEAVELPEEEEIVEVEDGEVTE